MAVADECSSVKINEQIILPQFVRYPFQVSQLPAICNMKSVAKGIVNQEKGIITNIGVHTIMVDDLHEIYGNLGENILQPLFNGNDSIGKLSDRYISAVSSLWCEKSQLGSVIHSRFTGESMVKFNTIGVENLRDSLKSWREKTGATFKSLREILDPLSIFAGRNILVSLV